MNYNEFLNKKTQYGGESGFTPTAMPDMLYPFQRYLLDWAVKKGRGAIFADCGMGKTAIELAWADNVAAHTGKPVLILTPLAVAFQTVREGEKFGIEAIHRRDGIKPGDRIVVTNYERLHYFNSEDYGGVICDESSILKNFDGETRKQVTEFLRKRPYRLLGTATAAPNDYIELGTSSEAIGDLGATDVISRFFKKVEKTYTRRDEHRGDTYRFRGHAEKDFWRWVCSWARSVRNPSDIGFEDERFTLPPLHVNEHLVEARTPAPGMLFDMPAITLQEQREELRRTLPERCEMAASLINSHKSSAVAWCHLNDESAMLKKLIPDSVEVKGSDSEEHKEQSFLAFAKGEIRVMVTKPSIAGFGLNWQHVAHQTYFASHSYEQYYQAVRRSWRFGQKKPVVVDIITTEGQGRVKDNLQRKAAQADRMFDHLVMYMQNELKINRVNEYTKQELIPSWL